MATAEVPPENKSPASSPKQFDASRYVLSTWCLGNTGETQVIFGVVAEYFRKFGREMSFFSSWIKGNVSGHGRQMLFRDRTIFDGYLSSYKDLFVLSGFLISGLMKRAII